jgi:hypothetical protein
VASAGIFERVKPADRSCISLCAIQGYMRQGLRACAAGIRGHPIASGPGPALGTVIPWIAQRSQGANRNAKVTTRYDAALRGLTSGVTAADEGPRIRQARGGLMHS